MSEAANSPEDVSVFAHQRCDGLRSTELLAVSQHLQSHRSTWDYSNTLFFSSLLPSQVAATSYFTHPAKRLTLILAAQDTFTTPLSASEPYHGQKRSIESCLDAIFPWWKPRQ